MIGDPKTGDQKLEEAMGEMLRIGVTAAALVALIGGVLYLYQQPSPLPDYKHFHGASPALEHAGSIMSGVFRLDAGSLIEFAILILIATPVCRVLFGVVGFALLRDRLYTVVSAIVLVILLLSLLKHVT